MGFKYIMNRLKYCFMIVLAFVALPHIDNTATYGDMQQARIAGVSLGTDSQVFGGSLSKEPQVLRAGFVYPHFSTILLLSVASVGAIIFRRRLTVKNVFSYVRR